MSELTTFYLEMLDREVLCVKAGPSNFAVTILEEAAPDVNRQFYQKVGGDWQWTERLKWSDEQWHAYVNRKALTTGVIAVDSQPAGYFEIESQQGGDVEIVQLGLLPEYVACGLGGALVTTAIESAWSLSGTRRVWLHTCTRDHQSALVNYKRRGFTVYKTVKGIE
ncbi:MAG: GNAT family N-acetyltransferase [Verrucomicrobiota bacterium]